MIGTRSFGTFQSGSAIDVPVAALAGLSIAFLAFAAPSDLLSDLIGSSGLPAILPAAEPPLGFKARIGIGAVGAVIVFALAFILLRWLDRFGSVAPAPARSLAEAEFEMPVPRRRRRDHHPDAPARAPLFAAHELGEPSLDPWPEPKSTPKRESELIVRPEPEPRWTPEPEPKWSPRSEPQATLDPQPQWTPEPVVQATPDPQPHWTPEPVPQATPEPVAQAQPQPEAPWSASPEPPAEPPARPGPVVELEADPVENAWRLSRPYDPVLREKNPTSTPWPHLDEADGAEGEYEDEDELEDETETKFEAQAEASDAGLVGSPWPVDEEPEIPPQAEMVDEPSVSGPPEPEDIAPAPETPYRPVEPEPFLPPEPSAAFSPPPRANSVEALLERLEYGLARRREAPAPQAVDTAPASQAPAAAKPSMPVPADDRLQSAIENLQRLAARRD